MRQRRALLGLTVAACIALVATGSHPVAQAGSSVTLRWSFWSNNPAEIHSNEQIISAFEKQNPGIKVQPIFIPYQSYHSKLLSEAVGGTAPDVMWVQYTYYRVFADKGVLRDLTSHVNKDTALLRLLRTDAYPVDTAKIWYKGHVYGLVRDDEGIALAYNTDMFKKAHLPTPNEYAARGQWTWSTFLKVAQRLTIKHGKQVVQYGTTPADWYNLLYLNGGSLFNKGTSRILIDTPQAEQAIQFAADLGTKYGVAPALSTAAQSTSSSYFTGQRAAMWWDVGPWWVPGLRQIKGLHWDIAPFPQAPGKPYRLPADNGAFYTIYAHTQHPNEAYKLVRFMLTPTAQMLMAKALTTSPLLKSVMYSQEYLKAPGMPEHAVLFANENASVVGLFFPDNWLEMQTKLNGYLDPIFLGQSTAAKTLPTAAQDLDGMLTH
jgi:multiple sugar transport system substrate-binding protein